MPARLRGRPVAGRSLALFRIAFGPLMLNDVVHVRNAGWLTRFHVEREIPFPDFGLEVAACERRLSSRTPGLAGDPVHPP